jgi:hypothetical protein
MILRRGGEDDVPGLERERGEDHVEGPRGVLDDGDLLGGRGIEEPRQRAVHGVQPLPGFLRRLVGLPCQKD